ncbi:carbon monoxide dehydrogenase (plasmid) [Ruegeria sp. AD91A]|uniref:CoxG family protein n=1 Tax=Ruegeria sp. AD91A TaxID=2293862 RepID=UPI000E486936|nr:carbon monoxide dehydrogenase subunit G [Ruegeria sp. AD91A]AXT28993.1 carbon monoxide dehydrogenase [Ruegeria sp. AD91A]
MELSDSRVIAAPRSKVWDSLLSAEVLKECVPGCQEMTGSVEDGFEATVVQKVGPVKATFKGSVTLSDLVALESVKLSGEGKGGAAGFAKGAADVTLSDVPEGTLLTYKVDARVGGKLAQLGGRVIDGVARKMADQFFENFQNAVEPQDAPEPEPSDEEEAGEEKKGWFKRVLGG